MTCPQHGPACGNWSEALGAHVTAPPAPPAMVSNTTNVLTEDETRQAEVAGGCISLAFYGLLVVIATALVTYGAIQLREIKDELRRGNDIECVRIQNEGYDSFSERDRRACPP